MESLADSSLDEPLHLEILSALASNLAKSGGDASQNINVLVDGLPGDNSHYEDEDGWVC